MFAVTFLTVILIVSSHSQDFIAPIYELGSYIPPLPEGDVKPGNPSPLPTVNYIEDKNTKPPVKPIFVLGSKVPISSIKPWEPIQIIPPGTPWPSGPFPTTQKPDKNNVQNAKPANSMGAVYADKFNNYIPETQTPLVLGYKPSRPFYAGKPKP